MTTGEIILAIIVSTILSAGGIGGIIIAVIKFSSDFIANRLSKKYELKLSKSLEEYKARLDDGSYISRTMFDKEFEIYQNLTRTFSEALHSMQVYYGIKESSTKIIAAKDINDFNPRLQELLDDVKSGKAVTEIQMTELHNTMCEQFTQFKQVLDESAAFIPVDNYALFLQLFKLCRDFDLKENEVSMEDITKMRFEMQKTIRKYLVGLTVIG